MCSTQILISFINLSFNYTFAIACYLSKKTGISAMNFGYVLSLKTRPAGVQTAPTILWLRRRSSHTNRENPRTPAPSIHREFSPSLTSVSVQVFCAFLKRDVITAYTIFPSEFKTFTVVTLNLQDWKTERYKEIIKSGTVSSMPSLFHKLTS